MPMAGYGIDFQNDTGARRPENDPGDGVNRDARNEKLRVVDPAAQCAHTSTLERHVGEPTHTAR